MSRPEPQVPSKRPPHHAGVPTVFGHPRFWQDTLLQVLNRDPSSTDGLIETLRAIGFEEPLRAWQRLGKVAGTGPSPGERLRTLEQLLALLSGLPNPDASLMNFERFVTHLKHPREMFNFLEEQPRAVEILVRLFVGSQYLTSILLRRPEVLEELTHHQRLADLNAREDFLAGALESAAGISDPVQQANAVRRYQRNEFLRLGVCDTFGLIDFRGVVNQLSLLADAIVECGLRLVGGHPERTRPGFVALAMGKLGGEELNYSSDIDLIFLSESGSPEELQVAQKLIRFLQDPLDEGFLYRVDMRLRPWGGSGPLVSTPAAFEEYIARQAASWEKQAMLKARPIAGELRVGNEALHNVATHVFRGDKNQIRESVATAKKKIEAELTRAGRKWGEIKSGEGSIRDIEFTVQFLQLIAGQRQKHVRSRNTLDALVRLADFDCLQADEYRTLSDGYVFLRTIEHALQLMHNKQVHTLPTNPRELDYLARRLDFPSGMNFLQHCDENRLQVRAIYEKYLLEKGEILPVKGSGDLPSQFATYESVFTDIERLRHQEMLSELTNHKPVSIEAAMQPGGLWRITVVGIDQPGNFSWICGLLFVYGLDIHSGYAFTNCYDSQKLSRYHESLTSASGGRSYRESPRGSAVDFVDVFIVRPLLDAVGSATWLRFADDLAQLHRSSESHEVHGLLAKRVAGAVRGSSRPAEKLRPIETSVDNESRQDATVLQIRAENTIGFLYEFSNALTLCGVAIQQVVIRSEGQRIDDTLLITDARRGGRITAARQLEELKAAVALIKQFTHLLPYAPNPEAALIHFRQFLSEMFQQPNGLEQLASLERPEVLSAFTRLLGVSDFLWQDFLRLQHSNLFPVLEDVQALKIAKPRAQLEAEIDAELHRGADLSRWQLRLNTIKDREMFRIDMRHILGYTGAFGRFSAELSDLAEVVVDRAVRMSFDELSLRHGIPRDAKGQPLAWSLLALGKCGGRELGFASDIELMLVYRCDATSDGPSPISSAEFFHRLLELAVQAIVARSEGIFQIDLRLRPYGNAGNLAVSLEAFESYFKPGGPAWPYERQALVKLRPISGSEELGKILTDLRDRFLYTKEPFDFIAMRAIRERQIRQLAGGSAMNAKLSSGGLVDCEYLVQALQITHGRKHPAMRTTNTREAIRRLRDLRIMPAVDANHLRDAYRFHRGLIDALRMVRGDARDLTVPSLASEEFEFLARRMGYTDREENLAHDLERHVKIVVDLVRRYSGGPADEAQYI